MQQLTRESGSPQPHWPVCAPPLVIILDLKVLFESFSHSSQTCGVPLGLEEKNLVIRCEWWI